MDAVMLCYQCRVTRDIWYLVGPLGTHSISSLAGSEGSRNIHIFLTLVEISQNTEKIVISVTVIVLNKSNQSIMAPPSLLFTSRTSWQVCLVSRLSDNMKYNHHFRWQMTAPTSQSTEQQPSLINWIKIFLTFSVGI